MEDIDCDLLQSFINDHSDIAFLYMLKQDKNTCDEMYEFIEEMHLMGKFSMYSAMINGMEE